MMIRDCGLSQSAPRGHNQVKVSVSLRKVPVANDMPPRLLIAIGEAG